jgi:hypothetical protein
VRAAALALLLFPLALCAAGATPPAGTVDFIEGDVSILKVDKTRLAPKKGDAISQGDSVVTGAGGEVHFAMLDGGYMAVRPNTRIQVTQYQANGADDDRSIIGVAQGALRVITGWIGAFNPRGYQIRASGATIGIRGTDHETLVRLKDDAEGEAGVYDRVYAGKTFISSKAGTIEVAPNRVGFHSASGRGPPRVLDRVPKFFRATRNERLIEGRHERIQSQLKQLREERRTRLRSGSPGKKTDKGNQRLEKKLAQSPKKKIQPAKRKAEHEEKNAEIAEKRKHAR